LSKKDLLLFQIENPNYEIITLDNNLSLRKIRKIPGFSANLASKNFQNNLKSNKFTKDDFLRIRHKDRKTMWVKKIILKYKEFVIMDSEIKGDQMFNFFQIYP
jgi:hypothetical protein